MPRFLTAPIVALLLLFGLATPAVASPPSPSVDIVVGSTDGSVTVRSVPSASATSTIASLERDPDVDYAELDVPVHAVGSVIPNDTLYGQQWGAGRLRAPEAWGITTGSPSVVVAVVDTGVSPSHPDLAGALITGRDFVGDGKAGDPNGHGTGVAGVIAARGNNGRGIAGYCWSCSIMPVRVLDANGGGTASAVAAGVRWAADHDADIINLSLAGDSSSLTLENAITYARDKGLLVVSAAGNQTAAGQDLTLRQYPAASPGVISVIATDESDAVYPWSYRGSWADLGAPGCVVTTAPAGYESECGTSFASPAVAGVLALAKTVYPQASPDDLTAALYSSSDNVLGANAAHGRADAAAFLASLSATFGAAKATERVAGGNRVATAVALSQRVRASATSVVIARSDQYADALAAAPLAGKRNAPVLLTPSAALAPEVSTEVSRLGATTAVLVGGTGALAPAVEDGLRAAGITDIQRLAGASRYETAASIAREVGGTSVLATDASGWPDAVAASSLAALTRSPIVLVDRDGVPSATSEVLAALGATSITVIGGSGVVSDATVTALGATGATVSRLAGATRYETSRAIADAAVVAGAAPVRAWLATGADWPDALAAGPAAAADGGVLLLVDGLRGTGASAFTGLISGTSSADVPRTLNVVGGPASVSSAVAQQVAALL